MESNNALHIRNKIKALKRDADYFGYCAKRSASHFKLGGTRAAEMHLRAAQKVAEWGLSYDEMLRGEYAQV